MTKSTLAIEHALLGFLRHEPRHGYAIHQDLSDPAGLGPVWRIKLGQLYALLSRLEDAGYVRAVTEPQDNRPPRKLYHLTRDGLDAYRAWLRQPVRHGRSLRLEFLVKLYFARREGAAAVAQLLSAQRAQCHEWLAIELASIDAETAAGRAYSRLVHVFRQGQIQAMLDWLDLCDGN